MTDKYMTELLEDATVCDNRGCDCGELIRARGNK
jgi:hypothetical protein